MYLEEEITFSDKLRAVIIPCIIDNFEKRIMKIYTPKMYWKDR